MKDRFPRDLFWTVAAPFVLALLMLAMGSILFRLWGLGGFAVATAGGAFALLIIVAAALVWRRHRRSTHT